MLSIKCNDRERGVMGLFFSSMETDNDEQHVWMLSITCNDKGFGGNGGIVYSSTRLLMLYDT